MDRLVAELTVDQAQMIARNAGRWVTVRGKQALLSFNESISIQSGPRYVAYIDFETPGGGERVSVDCQTLIDSLRFDVPRS